ncbi:hypothetical protein LCGC14_2225950 [marine sediment metagenome]|uniref:Uncharacterized protein n=1 Tax=marine sediment metagenome TaxID=412755 RepID=A0A0F9DX69_9ZZZZ
METVKIEFKKYQVEIDRDRGVLYIHSKEVGHTVVRICGMLSSLHFDSLTHPHRQELIDITLIDGQVLSERISQIKSRRGESMKKLH